MIRIAGGQRGALHRDRIAGELGQRDRHDLRREDEVGADRARDLPLLELFGRVGLEQLLLGMVIADDLLDDLLGRLEHEIAAADHQQGRDQERRERDQQHRHRQQDQELVLDAAELMRR